MCELLAPAGDEASFYAAVHSGTDAVYLGLTDFSARRAAANFSLENLKEHIDYAHALGVRVHVALNTLIKEDELARFFENVAAAWNAGADALIIQDIFLGILGQSSKLNLELFRYECLQAVPKLYQYGHYLA